MKTLALKVPSAIIPDEVNVIINPLHPDRIHVKIIRLEDFTIDRRLFHPK